MADFQRRHYEEVARALLATRPPFGKNTVEYNAALNQWTLTVRQLADAFAADNPNFKRARFLNAAGAAPLGRVVI